MPTPVKHRKAIRLNEADRLTQIKQAWAIFLPILEKMTLFSSYLLPAKKIPLVRRSLKT